MSSDWTEVSLQEVTSKLGDGLHGTPNYDDNGEYFFINGNNLGSGRIVVDEKTKRVSATEYLKHKKDIGDRTILVSINGTIGNVALYYGEKVVLGKSACYFNVVDSVDKQYVRYVVTGGYFQNYIRTLATGSTIKNVSLKLMRDFRFQLPPIGIQRKISKTLEDLDNKIELNRQTNQTLEQIAQALFKSWFVDFEPTRAKIAAKEAGASPEEIQRAAMCAISGKTPDQLAQLPPETQQNLKTTAALFPDALVDSELGEIPEGWEVKPFGELLTKTIGGDWGADAPDEKHTQEVKILRGTDLPDVYNGTDDRVPIRYVDPKKFANRKLEAGDIVIEVSGGSKDQPTGRSLFLTDEIIFRLNAELEPASFCRLFRPSNIQTGLILGLHLRKIYDEGKTWLYQNQSTGISNFQTQVFLEKEFVVVPPKFIAFSFYGMVMPILRKMSSAENKRLSNLRDQLLPKLLSGEIQLHSDLESTNIDPSMAVPQRTSE